MAVTRCCSPVPGLKGLAKRSTDHGPLGNEEAGKYCGGLENGRGSLVLVLLLLLPLQLLQLQLPLLLLLLLLCRFGPFLASC